MEEVWKPVVEYEQLYLISNLGNAKSIKRNKLLKPFKGNIVNCCKSKRKTAGKYIWKYCS